MKLKEIEIIGFKSFMDKTNVKFEDGITVVVGPNGTGKSNISDAIRWVLGEQSAKSLRGNRMEDVIFAGTSKRKALGYCEVTIIFDNESGRIPLDYSEVAITRRVFRSGESEYYINKETCRLRDIRELIMDTGIGKEGYSIIGQGKIDEILSNRPEDRRGIFEEASGIVKHKSKKEESERKLKRTEENLVRVNDIISELTRREKDLSVQSKKANKYLEIYSKLKELEINLYVHEIDIIKNKLEEIENELSESNKVVEENKKNSETSNFKLIEKKKEVEENQNKLELLNEEKFELIKNKNIKDNSISLLKERRRYSTRELKRLNLEIETADKNIVDLNKENNEIKKYLDKEQDSYEMLIERHGKEDQEFKKQTDAILELERKIHDSNQELISFHSMISEYNSEIRSNESLKVGLNLRIQNIIDSLEEYRNKKDETTDVFKEKNDNYIKKQRLLESLKEEFKDISKNIEKEEVENKKINNELQQINIKLETNSSSYRLFKNMEESYEGYYKGVRSILKAAERNKEVSESILGVVADLVKVEKTYELAISTALGGRAQNVVTKTQNDAKRIINYLRNNRLGRITCLPHDIIKGRLLNINKDIREEFNVCGLASELVGFDESNRNIVENLLGRVAIVPDMDSGIKLSNRFNNSIRIVTLKGDVINPGGSMSGGSQDNSRNLFSRKNKMIELEKEILEMREKKEELKTKKEKNENSLKTDLIKKNSMFEEIQSEEYSVLNLKNKLDNLNEEKERDNKSFIDLELNLENLKKESEEVKDKIISYKEKLKNTEERKKDIEERIENVSIELNKIKEIREHMNYQTTESRVILNRKKDELESREAKYEQNKKTLIEITSTRESKVKNVERIERELAQDYEEVLKLEEDLKGLIRQEENLEERIKDISSSIKAIRDELELEELKFSEINKTLESNRNKINKKEIKHAKNEVQLDTFYKNLLDNYNLEYKDALKYKNKEIDLDATRKETKKLNDSIKKLGNVNLDSIEEYEELLTRLDFMSKQVEDLMKAQEDLKLVIGDIEEEMKIKFIESFKIINKNFQKVFGILFDGGKSRIVLTDPENILDSGIEIEVEPPGKRLQNIMLLSGGEKSLTAVALLFAILEMKPSPFCILDEIDAALDEANIGRYKVYLESISEKTQFIIITHRKATMEMADVLYGVTMEERGVSKLLSVELKDYNDFGNKLLQG